jgi:glycosyltransferase involved in cell wall biosynthesis
MAGLSTRLARRVRSKVRPDPTQVMRTPWPTGRDRRHGPDVRVGIVVVNFNTARLISQLLFSLCRIVGRDAFADLVVVDNASTDGSRELLEALDAAGVIHLIPNDVQRYHGPGLTQAVSWLADRQASAPENERLDLVWAIDSDIVVLRSDTLASAVSALEERGVAAVGQSDSVDPEDLLDHAPLLHVCSLLFDPASVWQPDLPPFLESGLPSRDLQAAAERLGIPMVVFPFVEDGYLVHLGRGTLRAIADADDTSNRYHGWAVGHNDPHFANSETGPARYAAFGELFDGEVGELTPDALVAACRRDSLLTVA